MLKIENMKSEKRKSKKCKTQAKPTNCELRTCAVDSIPADPLYLEGVPEGLEPGGGGITFALHRLQSHRGRTMKVRTKLEATKY